MDSLAKAIPNRVRALRMEKGWSLNHLAERADTTAPTIMRLERSTRQLSLDWVDRLAKAFEISPIELLTGDSGPVELRQIPMIGRIAAGNWREAIAVPDEYVTVPSEFGGGPDLFALRPDGDSMNLIIPEGGYVLIDPGDAEIHDGRIYGVMNGEGETTVKRYRSNPSRLEPCSSNPEHKVISLGREAFTVIGRVIGTFTHL